VLLRHGFEHASARLLENLSILGLVRLVLSQHFEVHGVFQLFFFEVTLFVGDFFV
jgi:hypothetical protein